MSKICDRCGSDKEVKYTISMPCSDEHGKILYICEKCNAELLDFVRNKYSYKKIKENKEND